MKITCVGPVSPLPFDARRVLPPHPAHAAEVAGEEGVGLGHAAFFHEAGASLQQKKVKQKCVEGGQLITRLPHLEFSPGKVGASGGEETGGAAKIAPDPGPALKITKENSLKSGVKGEISRLYQVLVAKITCVGPVAFTPVNPTIPVLGWSCISQKGLLMKPFPILAGLTCNCRALPAAALPLPGVAPPADHADGRGSRYPRRVAAPGPSPDAAAATGPAAGAPGFPGRPESLHRGLSVSVVGPRRLRGRQPGLPADEGEDVRVAHAPVDAREGAVTAAADVAVDDGHLLVVGGVAVNLRDELGQRAAGVAGTRAKSSGLANAYDTYNNCSGEMLKELSFPPQCQHKAHRVGRVWEAPYGTE